MQKPRAALNAGKSGGAGGRAFTLAAGWDLELSPWGQREALCPAPRCQAGFWGGQVKPREGQETLAGPQNWSRSTGVDGAAAGSIAGS